jgi:hypothetical protein
LGEPETLSIRVPAWVKRERIREDVERLLEEKYGVVGVKALRKRFNVKKLSEGIDVSEQDVLGLREAEKKRLQASDNTRY